MSTSALKRISLDEYFALEEQAEFKSEYYDGEVFAMAGASFAHEAVATDLLTDLNLALRKKGCRAFKSDLKVVCPTGLTTYPDVLAFCGEPEFYETRTDTITNPQVIFEVLSPSTESFDRGAKFANYQSIPSLKEYVLLSQDSVVAEVFRRRDHGEWSYTRLDSREQTLTLETFDVSLSLASVFASVSDEPSTSDGEVKGDDEPPAAAS